MRQNLSRRSLLAAAGAAAVPLLAAPALAQSALGGVAASTSRDRTESVPRNISSFRTLDWRPYFDNTRGGAILCDIRSRALHFWSEDQSVYRLYPTSVPLSEDLTRRGRTEVVKKVVGPTWRPTPEMRVRNPEWPEVIGPGPDNPLGSHALYLDWQYYRIHGTHDPRKIGRPSSNGCIGLFNEQIAQLFDLAEVGTQVLLI